MLQAESQPPLTLTHTYTRTHSIQPHSTIRIKNSIKMMRMTRKIFKAQAVIFFTTSYQ